ncbi:MAG: ABC transporter permease [Acidimicrobiia bacterium]|nr:ABC transporter permease [Acidimicrobiia bacterium]
MLLLTRRDLQFRATRFAVVTLGVAVVMTLLFLMTGLIEQFNAEPYLTVDAIDADQWVLPEGVSGAFTASSTLSPDTAAAVEGPDAAEAVVARGSLNAEGRESDEVLVIGHVIGGLGSPEPTDGRPVEARGEVVLDRSAGFEIGDEVALAALPLTVVGLTDDTTLLAGLPVVFVSVEDARTGLFDGRPVVSTVLLSGDPDVLPEGTQVLPADDIAEDALGPLENAVRSVDIIRILLWVVAAIIIGAVVYLSALERARDFAVLKAIGATNRDLVLSIGVQAVLIALGAVGLAAILQGLIEPVFPLTVRVPGSAFWQIPIVSVVVALLAGLGGMRRVAGSDPAAAFAGPGA